VLIIYTVGGFLTRGLAADGIVPMLVSRPEQPDQNKETGEMNAYRYISAYMRRQYGKSLTLAYELGLTGEDNLTHCDVCDRIRPQEPLSPGVYEPVRTYRVWQSYRNGIEDHRQNLIKATPDMRARKRSLDAQVRRRPNIAGFACEVDWKYVYGEGYRWMVVATNRDIGATFVKDSVQEVINSMLAQYVPAVAA
jgi:hypothetical protein